MEGKHFDSLVRSFSELRSRRAIVGLAIGFGVGSVTVPTRARACRRGKRRCGKKCCGRGMRCHANACLPSCAAVLKAAGCELDEAGQWVCSGTDFGGSSLAGCDLSPALFDGADLSGVDLTGADLRGVSFANCTLIGADLEGADLSGVGWRHTTCPDGTNCDVVGGTCCRNLNGASPAAGC